MDKNWSKAVFFIAALLWGSSYAIQKPLLDVINPISFTFWNFFISGSIFLIYALSKKIKLVYRLREGIILGVFLSGVEILEMVGLNLTSSANTVFITNLGMLVIPFVGWVFFKDKVRLQDYLAIIVAIIGMYLLVGGLVGFHVGELVLLLSALSSAFYFIYSERFESERSSHMTTLCVQQFFVISIICIAWSLFSGDTLVVPHEAREELLFQVMLFTFIPYAIIQWASRWADEMVAALYDGVVEPLTGALVAWFVFFEPTTPSKMFGGLLMVLSFGFSALFSERNFIKRFIHRFLK